jgi:serine/threonine protein kinase
MNSSNWITFKSLWEKAENASGKTYWDCIRSMQQHLASSPAKMYPPSALAHGEHSTVMVIPYHGSLAALKLYDNNYHIDGTAHRDMEHRVFQRIQTIQDDSMKMWFPGFLESTELYPDQAALVMEHIDGVTANKLMVENQFDLKRRIQWVHDVSKALYSLHSVGIIHGDVQPTSTLWDYQSNIWRLVDFDSAAVSYGDDPSIQHKLPDSDILDPEHDLRELWETMELFEFQNSEFFRWAETVKLFDAFPPALHTRPVHSDDDDDDEDEKMEERGDLSFQDSMKCLQDLINRSMPDKKKSPLVRW